MSHRRSGRDEHAAGDTESFMKRFHSLHRATTSLFSIFDWLQSIESESFRFTPHISLILGPSLLLSFLDNAISLIRNPTKFWDLQSS
ncbi:cytochrome P450 710A [Spatholobus suberectus]|nr:cytochrome P450 710A [Spatholobus suberectus]